MSKTTHRIAGLILLGMGLFLAVSLLYHHPQDPGWGRIGTEKPQNIAGLLGAYLSSLLFLLCGLSGFLIPVALFRFSWNFFKGTRPSKKEILAWLGLILSLSLILGFIPEPPYLFNRYPLHGGLIGFLGQALTPYIGPPGVIILITILLILTFFLFAETLNPGALRIRFPKRKTSTPKVEPLKTVPEVSDPEPQETTNIEISLPAKPEPGKFTPPPLNLLETPPATQKGPSKETLIALSQTLQEKLEEFGVKGEVVSVNPGPVITVYEFKPAPGVKINRIAALADDLALGLAAESVRIVAPIPGKDVVGIEVSNPEREMVFLREIIASEAFRRARSPLTLALGKDISGQPVVTDLARMPHLLIAGATGTGKSVFLHSVILSLIYKSTPGEVRLLLIDPKRIELSVYEGIPYLLHPVVLEPRMATKALRWAVSEMERRYQLLEENRARNLDFYNQEAEEKLPYLVIIIDELADLMVVASKEVETLLTRLAQMARASGIHLLLATQRPSVDVITGLIKANFPARISFQVSSRTDSRTILDTQGAERLLGAGDMLFLPPGASKLQRIHGPYVSEKEVLRVIEFLKAQGEPEYLADFEAFEEDDEEPLGPTENDQEDELYREAVKIAMQQGKISVSMLQRRLRIGYNRAARLVERMEEEGIVGPSDGVRPRPVLVGRK
ncbi:DNA translocase FtsK [Thermosulfurimonas dismutans]|uniref:Cell division protein FtsK n=1 Tax=Thermosulfurimonas dismutans TaxID=999894 RepID=A0A179D1J3_9BACT|nr:DNA translocase FtsK [Thermosulfurimonas dismutans]OAQ19927.1 Cell division protein FtsK [Thermosulfurimonas dismutans]